MEEKQGMPSETIAALIGIGGLLVTVLVFILAYAQHYNGKLDELEHKIDEQCVQRDLYNHHNHGGSVPSENCCGEGGAHEAVP